VGFSLFFHLFSSKSPSPLSLSAYEFFCSNTLLFQLLLLFSSSSSFTAFCSSSCSSSCSSPSSCSSSYSCFSYSCSSSPQDKDKDLKANALYYKTYNRIIDSEKATDAFRQSADFGWLPADEEGGGHTYSCQKFISRPDEGREGGGKEKRESGGYTSMAKGTVHAAADATFAAIWLQTSRSEMCRVSS
jgi:hypothetical protein